MRESPNLDDWYAAEGRRSTEADCQYVCEVDRSSWCVAFKFETDFDTHVCQLYDDCGLLTRDALTEEEWEVVQKMRSGPDRWQALARIRGDETAG